MAWKHKKEEDILDATDLARLDDMDETTFLGFNQFRTARDLLPVYKSKKEIQYYIDKYSCLIIIAEAGSGKTTQIPQFLLEAGYGIKGNCIGVTLPRRIGVVAAANRVSEEVGCAVGTTVGYSVRMHSKFCETTAIKFMTDGSLVREIMQDPLLRKYTALMLDDVHERSLSTDILMGLLKKIRRKRPDLKLIVSSATLEAQKIARYFEDKEHNLETKIMCVSGRQYPVNHYFLDTPVKNFIIASAELARDLHMNKPLGGDILVFMTGQEEIELFISLFEDLCPKQNFLILPLHAKLPFERQLAVMNKAPADKRKIIVSTNIAESSVTIDGIVYVINACFMKVKYYDYFKNMDALLTIPISKSNAFQRAGRAGRVKAGDCYHLCSREEFGKLLDQSPPEIARANLAPAIVQLKCMGIANIASFDFFTKPREESLVKSLEILRSLKIIDDYCNLTEEVGKKISDFPLDPPLVVALLEADKEIFGCTSEMLILVSMVSCEPIFQALKDTKLLLKLKKKIGAKEGDHLTLINVYKFYFRMHSKNERKRFCNEFRLNEKSILQAAQLKESLEFTLKKHGHDPKKSDSDTEGILRCLCTGYFTHAAQRMPDGSYMVINSKEIVLLHPTSLLNAVHPEWVIYHEIVRSGQTGKSYIRVVSEVNVDWLTELVPDYYTDKKVEIAQKRHEEEILGPERASEKLPGEEPTKLLVQQESVELGVPKQKKPEGLRQALLKKPSQPTTKPRFMISDMDFDE